MEILQPYLLFLGDAPDVYCAGIAVNTKSLSEEESRRCLKDLEVKHGLDCVDPVRTGVGHIVERILAT